MANPLPSIVRPVVNRAAHLRITPRPSSISESREILRLISQFGEVQFYKNLKYDTLSSPQSALVIFKEENAAANFLRKSPIRVRMGQATLEEPVDIPKAQPYRDLQAPMKNGPFDGPSSAEKAHQVSSGSLSVSSNQPQDALYHSKPSSDVKIFQIQTNSARVHFRDQINIGHFHGSFALDSDNPLRNHLKSRVPVVGLSNINWRAVEKHWRYIKREKDAEHEGRSRRKSLRELYDESSKGISGFRDEALPSG